MNYDDLLKEMCQGAGNMILTSAGGFGKSHLIHRMQETTKDCLYVAPTGIAALNIRGSTIHGMFNLKPTIQLSKNLFIRNRGKLKLFESASALLIDEMSMIRADVIDAIDFLMRRVRNCEKLFGGIRIILVGDMFQLNQVTTVYERKVMRSLYPNAKDDFSFYNANVFRKAPITSTFKIFELQHNFRQEDDTRFAAILAAMRRGLISVCL